MDTNEIVIKKMQRHCAAMVSIFSENAFVSRASRRECIRIFKLFRSAKDVLTTWDRDCFRSDVLLRRCTLPGCSASRHRHKHYRDEHGVVHICSKGALNPTTFLTPVSLERS
jgi:hypothetical protein